MTPLRSALRASALSAAALLSTVLAAEDLTTETHQLTEVRNGIYLAQGTAQVFNSNALVIVNDEDVVVVDSHITPAKARDLLASIEQLTDKKVSTLINSHFHFDHAHGNQAFPEDVPIIGHEFTRMKLAGEPLEEPTYTRSAAGNQARLAQLDEEIAAAESDEEREKLEAFKAMFARHVADFDEIDPVPPDVTLTERMTLFRGGREIQVLFLGRAHTGGDLLVYFPQDRLVFTGDVAFSGPSFLGDGFVDEWPETLMNIKKLDIEIFVPGHGPPVEDLTRLDVVAEYYRDLWKKTAAAHASGLSAEQASETLDLTNHTDIPIQNVGVDLVTVQRMYHRIENPDQP